MRGDIIGKWDKAKNEVAFYPCANAETVGHEIGWHATYVSILGLNRWSFPIFHQGARDDAI